METDLTWLMESLLGEYKILVDSRVLDSQIRMNVELGNMFLNCEAILSKIHAQQHDSIFWELPLLP